MVFKTLKSKVINSFLFFVILPILIGAAVIITQLHTTENHQLDTIHTQMVKRVASEFQGYVLTNVDQLKHLTEMHKIDYNDPDSLRYKLLSQLLYNNNFDQILFIDAEGREIAHVHRYKFFGGHNHINYALEVEYIYPKLNGSMYFGDIHFAEETGEPIANVSFAIKDPKTDKLIGVLISSLRLKPIWNLLANIHVEPGQQIYILDSDKRLIGHPNPSMVLKDIRYDLPVKKIAKGISGEKAYLVHEKINLGNKYFTIVSEQAMSEAYKIIKRIIFIISIVIFCTFTMSILLIIFHIKNIVNPINHLSMVAKEIESGNFEKTADIVDQDEIGNMAKAFNKMTQKLRDNNTQLKEFNIGLQQKIDREIEKTRKMEQLFVEQKKFADMGQMINAIAHQWRQPLNNIGLIQQHLLDGFMSSTITKKEYEEFSDKLFDTVQNMSVTIDDFRTFFTSGKQRDRFNVIVAIVDFIKLISAQMTSSNIKHRVQCFCCSNRDIFDETNLDIKCKSEELEILGHSGEFKQVLQNIISNARDAFIENDIREPLLDISVDHTDSEVIIKFRDNAGGISDNILPNIFDPYFTTKEEGKGTGIGLYISKVIIDEHFRGRLYAENIQDGAEFVIKIPKAPKEEPTS